jgi:hypothetical protein
MLSRTFDAFGLTIRVQSSHEKVVAFLDRLLPPFPAASSNHVADACYEISLSPDRTATVMRDGSTLTINKSPSAACAELVADLQTFLACQAPGRTFIHAGVVALGDRALVLPARSGGGKTTLVAALLAAGAAYGSDEFAVVDQHGFVHPYPRQLALKRPGTYPRWTPFSTFGRAQFSGGIPVQAIVFTSFAASHVAADGLAAHPVPDGSDSGTRFRHLTPGEIVVRLLEHCGGARIRPAETLKALAAMAGPAAGCAGPRGEAEPFAESLTRWLNGNGPLP